MISLIKMYSVLFIVSLAFPCRGEEDYLPGGLPEPVPFTRAVDDFNNYLAKNGFIAKGVERITVHELITSLVTPGLGFDKLLRAGDRVIIEKAFERKELPKGSRLKVFKSVLTDMGGKDMILEYIILQLGHTLEHGDLAIEGRAKLGIVVVRLKITPAK